MQNRKAFSYGILERGLTPHLPNQADSKWDIAEQVNPTQA